MIIDIAEMKDTWKGESALFVGCGPLSGHKWKEMNWSPRILAANSSIVHLRGMADEMICVESVGWGMDWMRDPSYRQPRIVNSKLREASRGLAEGDATTWCYVDRNEMDEMRRWEMDRDPREYGGGLMDGSLVFPYFSLGTVCFQGLHYLCYKGVTHADSVGFDFCFADDGREHWTEDARPFSAAREKEWINVTKDCWITVSYHGRKYPTIWAFAMSAAWCAKMRRYFKRAGMTWTDHSDGLLQIPGIEQLEQYKDDPPHDVEVV